MTDPAALALDGINKRFGDVVALTGASLELRRNSVHALLGENGAGKTTLMRVAFGMHTPDAGTIRVNGSIVRLKSPGDAIALGIGMVHQHFTLVPAMTVAENVALGGRGGFDSIATADHVRSLARDLGFSVDPDAKVSDLSVSAHQRLELLKALSRDARVLILDEPTAVLSPSETDDLLARLRQLADGGRAVILITHKLTEALRVADDITVLRHGMTSLSAARLGVDENRLIEAMLGHGQVRLEKGGEVRTVGQPAIVARNVSIMDARGAVRIREATFEVRCGEIVGVAAVEGSGHRELLKAISGRLPISGGSLELPRSVGFVPDDRHRDGLVLDMTLAENYALRGAGSRRGMIQWQSVAAATRGILRDFDVRAIGENAVARTLSGGNQQKFILGRELQGPPPALVVENPTRGLDVRAAAWIQDQLFQARSNGVATVVYSADLDEVLTLADRMLVVYSGTVREVPVDRDVIGRAMLGIVENW